MITAKELNNADSKQLIKGSLYVQISFGVLFSPSLHRCLKCAHAKKSFCQKFNCYVKNGVVILIDYRVSEEEIRCVVGVRMCTEARRRTRVVQITNVFARIN